MKSFSKRVASFAMAAAMVLSVAAVSPVDAEAATAKITKKSSITAGKTYTYNVKNVTKSQYIKVRMSSGVTVKYNNKTVKKASTKINGGKTIALKVKATDKVGNYKATLKAVIYNKKNNKKVKTLTTQSTVKCTTLKVTSVQTASTNGKYLVATFNKALDSLNPADIEIRNLNTNELLGVEDVKLASNGKSATIVLAGAESSNATGTINFFVAPNVDYSFTVAKNGATASTNFTVDAIAAYVTVVNYNAELREITYSQPAAKNTNVAPAPNTVKVAETVCNADFQDLLGTTITVWFNKNNVATKLERVNETVVEGAFEYINDSVAVPYFKDKVTGKTYPISNVIGSDPNSDIHGTIEITSNGGAFNNAQVTYTGSTPTYTGLTFNNLVATNKQDYDYAKLALYSNGKVRAMVDELKFEQKLYVTKVDAEKNLIYCGNDTVNLKGYTIVDHNKLSSIKNIKVGDLVFVSTNNTYAEIYTTTKEGKIEAAYDVEFKLDGTLYKNANVKTVTKDSKGEFNVIGGMKLDAAKAFIAAGGAVTVFSDRAGMPVFVKGEQKTVAGGSWVNVLATDDLKYFNIGLKNYVQVKGFDGTANTTYDINEADLAEVTVFNRDMTGKLVKNVYKKSAGAFTVDNVTGDIKQGATVVVDHRIVTASPVAGVNPMIDVYKEANGTITKVNVAYGFQPVETFVGGKSYVKENTTPNQNYQITAGTPVYAYDATGKFVKVDYSKYSASTVSTNTIVYTETIEKDINVTPVKNITNPLYSVKYVVVKNVTAVPVQYVDGVIGMIQTAGGKAVEVNLYTANNSTPTKYDVFRDDLVKVALGACEAGDYVRIGLANDGKTVVDASVKAKRTTMPTTNMVTGISNIDTTNKKFITAAGTYTLAQTYTIVRKDKNYPDVDRYISADLADLGKIPNTAAIRVHKAQDGQGNDTGYVDVVIIDYAY